MKVKIIKKNIKEGKTATGADYCIKSLYVSFQESEMYDRIVKHLKAQNIFDDAIERFCKPNDYNGVTSYAFGLNCSNFTFDRVERFGILDAKISFAQNEKGFVFAKIMVVDKKEQVNGYEPPEDEVTGWTIPAPEISADPVEKIPDPFNEFSATKNDTGADAEATNDLPF
jgi:hypothetical protein